MNNFKSPLVSICIPVFNGELYIERALTSCILQTYNNTEVIIVDNNSNDLTCNLVKRIKNKYSDKNINLFINKINIGITNNFNKCLEYSKGDYIKFVCADDFLEVDCLLKMVNELELQPKASMVVCSRWIVDSLENKINLKNYPSSSFLIDGITVINKCLFSKNIIGEPTAVMFRNNINFRGFDINYNHLLDLEMWFYLLEKGPLINIPDALCSIRKHKDQESKKNLINNNIINDNLLLYNSYSRKDYISDSKLMRVKWYLFFMFRFARYLILKL